MGKLEAEIQAEVQMQAMKYGCHLMRNNSGALKDATGRVVRYGLGNVSKDHNDRIASSDLIGFTKVLVTPEMVGQTIAVFTAVECKREDWKTDNTKRTQAQNNFLNFVAKAGGIAFFANSVENFIDSFRRNRW